jgi:stearoyl-CoA desaturase (delta-9 desaturase)
METLKETQQLNFKMNYIQNITILLIHLLSLAAIINWDKSTPLVAIMFFYSLRVFFVAGGIHRYFCHKTFTLNRVFQFIFALGATLSFHHSILWWVSKHRKHHKFNDKDLDPHSYKRGFFWSHIGWVLCDDNVIDENSIKDLTKFKELVFLHKHYRTINLTFAMLVLATFGFSVFCSVYCLGIVLSWNTMFLVNSLGHHFGYRNFKAKDNSTNIFGFSLLSLGEGLHNNHHSNPSSPNNRVKWFEVDLTYCTLYLLSLIKVVHFRKDLKK